MDVLSVGAAKEAGLATRIESYRAALAQDGNEAQTRFHLINEFLIVELDWPKESIRVEPFLGSVGYADYALFQALRCRAILEAKRDNAELCASSQDHFAVVPISSSLLTNAKNGIDQAIGYASRTGSPIGIVTNGRQWIGFLSSRSDGLAPTDGHAVVFPSVAAIVENWTRFYEFFSAVGLEEQRLARFVREKEGGALAVAVRYYRAFDRSYKNLPSPSELAKQLEELFRRSFIKLNSNSIDVLVDCFVESKDSKETDVAFEKIVDELVDRIFHRLDKLDSTDPEALHDLLQTAIELKTGEFVLLVGNKGSGKTTFLQRFFRKRLPKSTREKLLFLSIDLLKGDGSEASLSDWLSFELIRQAEHVLFGDTPTYDLLRGAFWRRYKRMKDGEHAHLYKTDPDQFRIKFGDELRDFRQQRPREYLIALLQNAVAGRGLLPVLVFDNVDHYPRAFQDRLFQYAIGISNSVISFLVCPVTDTTVWSLSKAGPLQSFHSRAFFLPVPSLKDVFAKRLEVLRQELSTGSGRSGTATIGKGLRLSIDNLNSFCATVEAVFVASSDVSQLIGRLCNYDVRRSLEFSGAMLASPWIGIEELFKLYVTSGEILPKRTNFVLALILLRASLFDEDKHSFVLNVFARPPGTLSSPLMALYMLRYLISVDERAATTRDRFVSISELWVMFSMLNVPRETFRYFVDRLFARQLLEAYDPSVQRASDETLVRVSPAGVAHYRLAVSENAYISQMALVTELERESIATEIREEARAARPGWLKVCRIFLDELLRVDKSLITVPTTGAYAWLQAARDDISVMRDQVAKRQEPTKAVVTKHPRAKTSRRSS